MAKHAVIMCKNTEKSGKMRGSEIMRKNARTCGADNSPAFGVSLCIVISKDSPILVAFCPNDLFFWKASSGARRGWVLPIEPSTGILSCYKLTNVRNLGTLNYKNFSLTLSQTFTQTLTLTENQR